MALSLIIGLAALAAFIFLNRMMAPPFPKFAVSPLEGLTNAIRQAASNSPPTGSEATRTNGAAREK
jgi:hypothetical protein